MKNELLRIIAVAVVASLVLISWMKSRSDANAEYESNKVEIQVPQDASSSQISFKPVDHS
ncbi:hypothetical protein JM83_3451 [Gillisia sp. Hel_I_86]|uniref:hypothetical protein n=1 Tax=Gillisia sp. Hel_I_86 TaxID=1249981 RepID=UPI001198D52A|nr:hypothetical protein [Gillisia sp. Hel_I_86]TVZ28328.1 hypothetical protein JM83_3451 [Gillisia sp. Hel_I_86]